MLFNKKTISILVLTSFMFSSLSTNVFAKDGWRDVTWKQYNLKFTLPKKLKTTKNTSDEFVAEDDSFMFEMYPWKDSADDAKSIADDALKGLGLKNVSVTSKKKRDLNTYKGYEIMGEGTLDDGTIENFSVLGFIDPNSSTNFMVYIMYLRDRDENKNIEIERDIIESIEPANN